MSYVGQSVKRFEDPRLATGNGAFVGDLTLPDMLHATVLRSQHAHAHLRAVEVAAARTVPGVVAVLTGADIAGVLPGIPTRAMVGERAVDALQAPEHPLLAQDKVCYVGQPVAVVVAQHPYVARDAVELITVDYDPLAPILDPIEAATDEAPVIHEAMGTNVAMRLRQRAGDLEEALARADHVIRQQYLVQRVAPAPLETRGVLAHYQLQEDLLTVWNATQAPHRVKRFLSHLRWRAKARQQQPDAPLLGIGLATFLKSSGASGEHRSESARVTIAPSGHITVNTGISPHGQGSETAFAQIVAEALGVHPAQVLIRHGDTALFPVGEGTSASRGLIVGGSAVYAVVQEARQHLAHLASELLACPAEDVCFQNGRVFNRHKPEAQLTFPQLVAAVPCRAHGPVEGDCGLDFRGSYTLQDAPVSFGAHAVVVEVSRETGEVTILRYVGVHDCGRIINPRLVEGQIAGGIAQGIGQALTESMVYSPEGQPLTGSLLDYALPKAREIPPLILETLETPSPTNPLGAKGIGSVSTVPAPAAVANAVLHALSGFGVRHLDTPLTAEKIWRAMQGAGERQASVG